MKLHLACGSRNFGNEWIHIDGGNFDHVHYHDIVNLSFNANSVDLIYASHVLGYFDRQEVVDVLIEWMRVLKTGGLLRLAVPDFQAMANLYVSKGCPLVNFLGPLYGRMQMNNEWIYHKTCYDFLSLKELLEYVGFNNIRKYDHNKTEHAQFDDHSQAYIPKMDKVNGTLISLNVECNA